MRKLFTKYYTKILTALGVVFILSLNYAIFRFQSYAVFRDYIIVRDQDIVQNSLNPLLFFIEYTQSWLLTLFKPNILSTFTFSSIFSIGFFVIFYSLKKFSNLLHPELSTLTPKNSLYRNILPIASTFILMYNPFTLERFFMGQDRVIFGLFLVVPYLVLILYFLKKRKEKYLISMLAMSFLLVFVNIHALVLVLLITLTLSFLFPGKKLTLLTILNVLLVIVSLILNFNLLNTNTNKYYLENIANNSNSSLQIVEAFSLKEKNTENLIIKGITGSASWNTPSFIDIDQIIFRLAELGDVSYYTDNNWAIGFFLYLLMNFGFSVYLLYKSKISKYKLIFISISPFIILYFSFGMSLGFTKSINQFWYLIPGSYILREPGKVYYLFLSLTVLSVIFSISKIQNQFLRKSSIILLTTYAVSGFLPFTQITNSLNYVTIPNIYNYSLSICNNRKLLYLPDDLYISPNWSKTFIVNPLHVIKNSKCDVLNYGKIGLLNNNDKEPLRLESSDVGKKLDEALDKYSLNLPVFDNGTLYVDNQKQKENINNLLLFLRQQKIELLLIDSSQTKNGYNLVTDLNASTTLLKKEGDDYLFQL